MPKGYLVAINIKQLRIPNALDGAEDAIEPEDMLVLEGLKDLAARKGLLSWLESKNQSKMFLIVNDDLY